MSNKMIDHLPFFMRNSTVYQEIFNSEEQQFTSIDAALVDIDLQRNIDTATWGLDIYEKELGIKTDLSKSLADRRSVIKSRLRGSGKVDSLQIQLVVEAYTNGVTNISFNGSVIVEFVSPYGIPNNLEDVKKVIDDLKPAHLPAEYRFRYYLVKELHGVMTIGSLHNTPLGKFAGGVSNVQYNT